MRSLERLFLRESGVAGFDELILMILTHGNDYLPKVRGSSFHGFFKAYKQVRNARPLISRPHTLVAERVIP